METLYKSSDPKTTSTGEYYQVWMDTELRNDEQVFIVREKHGWWDAADKKAVDPIFTLSPEEAFPTHDEARKRYDQQVAHRVAEGFRYSFRANPESPTRYDCVDLAAA